MFELFRVNEPEDADMSFWEHLDQLRPRLWRIAVAFLLFMVAGFAFGDELMTVITAPKLDWFPTNRLFAWLAEESGIVVLATNKRMYEACGKLYMNGLVGNGRKA